MFRQAQAATDTDMQDASRATLERLLEESYSSPAKYDDVARRIDALFGQERAVMVLDMSGFSLITHQHGIISSLVMIHQAKRIAQPRIEANGGHLVKAEADNLLCLFDTAADALRAAVDLVRGFSQANQERPVERHLFVSIGIGFGWILNVGNEDLFGHEVNVASKLGEDVGQRNEILMTSAAFFSLPSVIAATCEKTLNISGLAIPYYVIAPACP